MKEKIIITGGAGFIGSCLARKLLGNGYDVLILDNLLTGRESNISQGTEFIKMDISDHKALARLSGKGIKTIFHLAAQSSGEISHEEPVLDVTTNSVGTLLLLKWARDNGIKRFLFTSSMAVYGQPDRSLVAEETELKPISLYGISKMTAEHYVRHFGDKGINGTVFRLFSVYGPGQDLENMKQGMVSIFLAYILMGQRLHVKGSGQRFRDLVYVDDVTDAMVKAMNEERTFGETYNIGTGVKTLISELVDIELKAMGKDPSKYPVKYEGSTPDDQFGLFADISKIRKDLKWSPAVTLKEGIRRMAEWAKKA